MSYIQNKESVKIFSVLASLACVADGFLGELRDGLIRDGENPQEGNPQGGGMGAEERGEAEPVPNLVPKKPPATQAIASYILYIHELKSAYFKWLPRLPEVASGANGTGPPWKSLK